MYYMRACLTGGLILQQLSCSSTICIMCGYILLEHMKLIKICLAGRHIQEKDKFYRMA